MTDSRDALNNSDRTTFHSLHSSPPIELRDCSTRVIHAKIIDSDLEYVTSIVRSREPTTNGSSRRDKINSMSVIKKKKKASIENDDKYSESTRVVAHEWATFPPGMKTPKLYMTLTETKTRMTNIGQKWAKMVFQISLEKKKRLIRFTSKDSTKFRDLKTAASRYTLFNKR